MKSAQASLMKRLRQATGPDGGVDTAVAAMFGGDSDPVPSYTASVDACIALMRRTLPDWHWHVGHGPSGIVPYASMTRNADDLHVEATAPTVPLALLGALLKAVASR